MRLLGQGPQEISGKILLIFQQHANGQPRPMPAKHYILGNLKEVGALDHTLGYLHKLENDCEREIARLEERFQKLNHMLRLVIASLSMKETE